MLSHQAGQTQQTQHAQQEHEQQDTQHGQQHAGTALSEQQLRSLPQEVLLVGIDPDCSGAIAVVRSPLHWSLTPPGGSTSISSSKRSCTKRAAGGISCKDGSSSDVPSSSSSSSNGSNSSSTAEVQQLQAFMGLPAVRVYDMPVETIITKTKTSTGKRRVRR
jgi:hypothetical protein